MVRFELLVVVAGTISRKKTMVLSNGHSEQRNISPQVILLLTKSIVHYLCDRYYLESTFLAYYINSSNLALVVVVDSTRLFVLRIAGYE